MSSSSCVVCGCEQFNLIDGFFYCALCNAQSQVQREVDLEDANILGNVGAVVMTKLGTNAAADGRKRGRQKRKMQHSEEQMASWAAVETDDYPRFLKRAGLRIATFTKLLSRYSNILIRDFNVAPTIRDHALGIFQRYLRHLNVAFCDEEINEENPYCPLVRNIDYEAQIKESQRQAQMEKERKLHSGKDILAQLTGNDLDEDLTATAIREEAIDRGDVQLVTEVRTKLSLEAFHRLLIIPLTHEILLVIVYLACLCAGARWILLSDVTRWYREGRFPLSFSQRFALIPVEPGVDDDRRHCHIVSIATPILSLFEMMRVVLAVCQMTDIPVQPISVDFDQIICRFCFNLNLPSVFVERVRALCAYLTPNCDLSQELSRRFGHFDSSVLLKYAMSPSSFNVDIGFENSENDSSRYLTGEKNVRHCMLPTPEVKAIAIILFALKLTFGLDDRREYGMTQRVANNVGSSRSFEFPLWIHQLRMRMDVWRGRTLKNVLEKRKHLSASYRGEETLKQTKLTELCDGRKVPFFLGKPCPSQDILFKGCAPNYVVNEAKEYAFYSTFADDIEPRPAEYIDREALIAPLRYQATRNDEWYNDLLEEEQRGAIGEQAALIDRYNTDLFFKSFKEYEMNYEECAKGGCCRKNSRRAEGRLETDHERLRWRHLFPCAGNYISYPHPVFTRHLFRYERQRSIICEPIAYAKALDLIMRTARIAFSESFTFLLEMLSLIIGEDQKVVYAFFLMVEMLYINCQTINELKELIEDRHELITCVQVCSLNCPPIRLR
uniref:TATA box-binding protein-associated factor RNA polymerase I subunit B n=1 Tax=Parascaris univalens TaxID=6257 RepID=A0A915CJS7_PARUN